jgi:hypothetical protein
LFAPEKRTRETRTGRQGETAGYGKRSKRMTDDNSGIVGEIYKRQRRPPLNFIKMGVPLNAVIMFDNNGISVEAKVLSEKKVIYNGVEYFLTKLTRELLEIEYNIHPTRYWYYNGKCLREYYDEAYGD